MHISNPEHYKYAWIVTLNKQLEGLDLNLILALHWLLAERGVTAAATRLGLSQPAASRALGRLRNVFQDQLLIRSGRAMVLSRKAEILKPHVARAVELLRNVMTVSEVIDPATQTGSFKIACSDHWGALLSYRWIECISPQAPLLELGVIDINESVIPDLISGNVDLAILPDLEGMDLPAHLNTEQFVLRPFHQDRYVCALRADHPHSKKTMSLEQYVALRHILVNPQKAQTGIVDEFLHEKQLSRKIAFRAPQFFTALSIMQKTDCILTAPESLFIAQSGSYRTFSPPLDLPSVRLNVVWHPNWSHSLVHKWVREQLFQGEFG